MGKKKAGKAAVAVTLEPVTGSSAHGGAGKPGKGKPGKDAKRKPGKSAKGKPAKVTLAESTSATPKAAEPKPAKRKRDASDALAPAALSAVSEAVPVPEPAPEPAPEPVVDGPVVDGPVVEIEVPEIAAGSPAASSVVTAVGGAVNGAVAVLAVPEPAPAEARRRWSAVEAADLAALLRVGEGFDLSAVDAGATPGFDGSAKDGEEALALGVGHLTDLQERLWAASRGGDRRSVLLVVQGMDTAGKGGIVRHVVGACDPQGVAHTAFKAPTPEERAHDFLWRIRQAMPQPGEIGVFDRSHYEDVLVVRVHGLVPRATWARRYTTINRFEATTTARGTAIVKVMLHVSKEEQRRRLAERLERPDKYWKYNPGDVDERALWDDYQEAYQVALTKCSTEAAPWYVVPADHKWYARWAVQHLLTLALEGIDPQWPPADFDVEAEKERVASS